MSSCDLRLSVADVECSASDPVCPVYAPDFCMVMRSRQPPTAWPAFYEPVLPAALSGDLAAAFDDDESAAVVDDCRRRPGLNPRSELLTANGH
jgi:hypothetical protein